jgi:hypothetical protein
MLLKKLNEKWVKLTDFLDRPALKNRLLFYISILIGISIIFIVIFGAFHLIFSNFTFPASSANYDNERYLLSALVQSLAATIALVITLSLVAVQLAAQSYSPRVIEVYKRNPDMWILFCIYIITIFYGLGLIKVVGPGISGINMEGAIFLAYFMGFFAFVCLVPYMLKTLDLLKPLSLLQLLTEHITKDKILNYLKINGKRSAEDPLLPIVDVINNALARNDDETVRNGVLEIKELTTSFFEETNKENILKFIIQHIENIGIQASEMKNENSSISVILVLDDIKRKSNELNLEETIQSAAKALENMKVKVLNQRLENASVKIIDLYKNDGIKELKSNKKNMPLDAVQSLSQICTKAIDMNMNLSASGGIEALRDLGLKTVEDNNLLVSVWIIGNIDNIGTKAATNGNDFVANTAVKALKSIVVPISDKNKGVLLERVLYALDNISVVAIDKKLELTMDTVTKMLEIVATESIGDKYEDEDFATRILKKLERISIKTIDKELENVFMSTAVAIKNIGMKAAEQKLEAIVIEIAEILENVEGKAAEKKLMQSQWIAIDVLKDIGVKVAENGLEDATKIYEIGLETLMQKTDESDDMQKMFIDPAIEKALHSIEKAKEKREEDT